MQIFLTLLKWAFRIAALRLAGLALLLTLPVDRGVDDTGGLLLSLLYCAPAAFPGLPVHLVQKSPRGD